MKDKIIITEDQLKNVIKEAVLKILPTSKKKESLDIEKLFNFSSIPDEELKQQYIDLSFTVSSSGYGGKFIGVNGKILKEEATTTLSVEETKKEIQNKFHIKDWQFSVQKGANGIRLIILYPGIFKNTKLIKDAMLACGWSLALKGHIVKNKMIWRAMSFDPIFQDNVSDEAKKYSVAYHWTPLYNLESIKTNGLTPKSQNKLFQYPDRLHLIKGNTNRTEIFNIGFQLCKTNKQKSNNGKYVLLSIDLSQIPKDVEIYYDPRYECGYYVKVPISPKLVKPLFGYNFKTNELFNV